MRACAHAQCTRIMACPRDTRTGTHLWRAHARARRRASQIAYTNPRWARHTHAAFFPVFRLPPPAPSRPASPFLLPPMAITSGHDHRPALLQGTCFMRRHGDGPRCAYVCTCLRPRQQHGMHAGLGTTPGRPQNACSFLPRHASGLGVGCRGKARHRRQQHDGQIHGKKSGRHSCPGEKKKKFGGSAHID